MVLNNGGNNNKKRSGKIPKIVATFVYDSSQGQRTHSARTNMDLIAAKEPPKSFMRVKASDFEYFVFSFLLLVVMIGSLSMSETKHSAISFSLNSDSAKKKEGEQGIIRWKTQEERGQNKLNLKGGTLVSTA